MHTTDADHLWGERQSTPAHLSQVLSAFAGLNGHFFGLPHFPAGQGEQEETPG